MDQNSTEQAVADPTDPGYDVNVLREHVRHLERRIRQLSASAPVDDGWRLVPIEPTEAMEQAAADYLDGCVKVWGLWKAMLEAAPQSS